jgi:hypothetical protein
MEHVVHGEKLIPQFLFKVKDFLLFESKSYFLIVGQSWTEINMRICYRQVNMCNL